MWMWRRCQMRIQKIDIFGYGKWINQQFNINHQLQVFYGMNEAGKSTLQSFIKSILFGFPDKRQRKIKINRYEPRETDQYGGRILLTDTKQGDIWVERTKKGLKVTHKDGETLPEETLKDLLGGLDERLFDTFYNFNLNNLQELSNVSSEALNDYFLSIGTTGSDKFLQLSKEFEKQNKDLYGPSARVRPLNKQLDAYAELEAKIGYLESQLDCYNQLVRQRDNQDAMIADLNQQQRDMMAALQETDALIQRYDIYLKDRQAKRQLDELIFTPMPDNAATKVKEASSRLEVIKEETVRLKERIKQIQQQKQELTLLEWATNHQEEREKWQEETLAAKENQNQIEQLERLISEVNENLDQIAKRSHFDPEKVPKKERFNTILNDGVALQANLEAIINEMDDIVSERNYLQAQRRDKQNYRATVRQQIAQIENQRINDEELLIQETSLKDYWLTIGSLTAGGLMIIASKWLDQPSYQTIGVIFIVVAIAAGVYVFLQHRNKINAFNNHPSRQKIEELKQQEKVYSEDNEALSTEINNRDELLQEKEQTLTEIELQQKNWLQQLGFHPNADPDIVLKTNPVESYFNLLSKRETYLAEKKLVDQKVTQWQEAIVPLLKRFPTQSHEPRILIRHVENIEAELQMTLQKANEFDKEIQRYAEQIDQLNQEAKSKQATIDEIFKATESRDYVDFQNKITTNQKIEQLTSQRQLYHDQIHDYLDELQTIKTKQSLTETQQVQKLEIERITEELGPHRDMRAQLKMEIEQLEQDGQYDNLLQEREFQKERLLESMKEWGQRALAINLIQNTLRQGLENPLPEMVSLAESLFNQLTFGRYVGVKINKSGVRVKHASDIYFEPYELSQGTLEQLYIALRLAFIITAKDLIKLPIMIDDAFVNFDELRKTSMYQVLEAISEEIQVLFFTFDEQAKESFSQAQMIFLEDSSKEDEDNND